MNIKTNAVAGTLESSDVYVKVEPSDKLEISIESVVYNQFAQEIEKSIREVVYYPWQHPKPSDER